MRVVHFTVFAPSHSGMYESTRDQIKYERREGLDSNLIDGVRLDAHEKGFKDEFLEPVNWELAKEADIWVTHSNIPEPLKEYIQDPRNREKHKIVSIMHGPCEHMILKEWMLNEAGVEDEAFTVTHINAIWNWDACVVLNQHEYNISEIYDENKKLIYIPNSIDLERYDPDDYLKPNTCKWEYLKRPAIIVCDTTRIEKVPTHVLFAMPRVIKKIPNARLNMFGLPLSHIKFFRFLLYRSKGRHLLYDCVENTQLRMQTVTPFIRGADIGFNNNYSGICSRVHMEMQAMGVPVVSYNGEYTDYHAKIFDLDSIAEQIVRCWEDLQNTDLRDRTIAYAREHYDRGKEVKKYVALYQKLMEEK